MKRFSILLMTILIATGCASSPELSNKDRNEVIKKTVEELNLTSVKKVNAFRFSGWQSLTDNYLVLSSSPKRKYLIEIAGFCSSLNFANAIIVNQGVDSTLSAKFDSISVASEPRIKCLIQNIYPIDKGQLKTIKTFKNNEEQK